MFTGIVEELGTVLAVERLEGDAARLSVRGSRVADGVRHGDSVAVDGVCLTVNGYGADPVAELRFDLMGETLRRSTLGGLAAGDRVNLERALRVGDRLGGHVVQGHVDGTGVILERVPAGHWEAVRISLPAGLARYVVEKGSVAVDGVSLTVATLGTGDFMVGLVPATLQATTLGHKALGGRVNLEVDVLAKYVERLLGDSVTGDRVRDDGTKGELR